MAVVDSVHKLMKVTAGHILIESPLLLKQVKQLPTIDIVHHQVKLG